jgi:hypothetical protein
MKTLALSLLALLIIFSCKKKETSPSTPPTNSGSGSTTGGSTTGGNGTSQYQALFEIRKTTPKVNGQYLSSFTNVEAHLQSSMVTNEVFDLFNYQDMGQVKLNTIVLKKTAFFVNNYNDTTYFNHTSPYVWQINGSSNLSALNFTHTTRFPVSSNLNPIPDSVSKSAGLIIPLSSATFCDFVQLIFTGPQGSSVVSSKYVSSGASTVGYTAQEIGGFAIGNGILTLNFVNDSLVNHNGKIINFRSTTGFTNQLFKVKN